MIKRDIFRKEKAALERAESLGCEGTHKHDGGFMPCKTHKEWEKLTQDGEKQEGEIDELIDFDGTMLNSKIPILDPHVTPKKTTDQTVKASRTSQDPYALGFRRYVGEEDLSKAFGWDETKDLGPKETIDYLEKELGVDNAEERALEMGKDPDLDDKKTPGSDMRLRLQEKEKMFTKEEILKMKEDIFVNKNVDNDIQPVGKTMSKIILRNLDALKKLAKKEGVSPSQLAKYLKDEQ